MAVNWGKEVKNSVWTKVDRLFRIINYLNENYAAILILSEIKLIVAFIGETLFHFNNYQMMSRIVKVKRIFDFFFF